MSYEPAKTKTPQMATPDSVQGRDLFQTPSYAVDILIPFLPYNVTYVWEPASGDGRIARRLLEKTNLDLYVSDIRESKAMPNEVRNFLVEGWPEIPFLGKGMIITNPPFSLKKQFYERCRFHELPFALLIPADYSGWIIQATIDGAEKIIPTRRIDYITPNILTRIREKEVWKTISSDEKGLEKFKELNPKYWEKILEMNSHVHNYSSIDEVPQDLLYQYSSSDFHSMWLTWGFNLGRSETFVDLPIKVKKENI